MDRISSLPDGIVSYILSFLSTKEAALTCVLAKRWRNLFAFSPNLYVVSNRGMTNSLVEFMDRVLAVSGSCVIKQFTLKCSVSDPACINRWLCNVLSRGVSDLHLHLLGRFKYSLPLEVFSCKTIVKLKLAKEFEFVMIPEHASLPALKSLFLESMNFYHHHGCCAFEAFISACPVLEELVMLDVTSTDGDNKKWYCTVSCPTLQRLTIRSSHLFVAPPSQSITFDTPSLAYFEYHEFFPQVYSVNFDSVVEAKLYLFPTVGDFNPTNLIQAFRNVEILDLSLKTLEILYLYQEAIPVFKKLHHLSIKTKANNCWRTLPLFLKKSPNLETLVIEGAVHYDGHAEFFSIYPCLSSCPVKVLEITLEEETMTELNQLKHFLEKLPCLELVKIRSCATNRNEQMQFTKDILNLPRSSECKIQFEFIPPS